MSEHHDIRDLIPAVALGAATPDEAARVSRHAATCSDCRAELDAFVAAAAGLATEVPQLDPPPHLKRRVMTAVRQSPPQGRGIRVPRRTLWPALAGALAALSIGLVAWNLTLRTDPDPRVAIESVVGAPAARGAVTFREDGTAVVRIAGMPDLPADKAYELWTIRDGRPRSEGFAARTPSGDIVVATADLTGASALAITPESRTNVAAPTVEPIVIVPVSASLIPG